MRDVRHVRCFAIRIMKKTNKKLVVKRETVRAMAAEQLQLVAGGTSLSECSQNVKSCGCNGSQKY